MVMSWSFVCLLLSGYEVIQKWRHNLFYHVSLFNVVAKLL